MSPWLCGGPARPTEGCKPGFTGAGVSLASTPAEPPKSAMGLVEHGKCMLKRLLLVNKVVTPVSESHGEAANQLAGAG